LKLVFRVVGSGDTIAFNWVCNLIHIQEMTSQQTD